MKNLLLVFLFGFASPFVLAHDHVEIGVDPLNATRLGFDGPGYQLATYVPPGEPFSGYLPDFPGDWFACELTFTTEVNALEPAPEANPRIEVLSVQGPPGGSFVFFELGETTPAWSKPAGWTNAPGDAATIDVILGGENHVHGRAFAMDLPGEYTVVFRAVDMDALFTPTLPKAVTFVAQSPPRLAVTIAGSSVALSFSSRLNLDYDLQYTTNVASGGWSTQTTIFGDGQSKNHSMSINGMPQAFFRLVEY